MDESMHNFKKVPICVFIAITITVIFSLYISNAIKSIPCKNDVLSIFYRNFVHVEFYHLVSNLFALYALSRVEKKNGIKKFLTLIIFIITFNTIFEIFIYKIFPNTKCSIGFSGVLFGIMTWELVNNKKLDKMLLLSIIIMILIPSIQNTKASLSGHIIGAISGFIAGNLSKKFNL